jgi:hypothetical protein
MRSMASKQDPASGTHVAPAARAAAGLAALPATVAVSAPAAVAVAATIVAAIAMVALLALGACASPGRPSRHFAPYTDPIKEISLHNGHLGYEGLTIGMTFHQVESTIGKRLPSLKLDPRDGFCGFAAVEVMPHRQPLRLEFDAAGGEDGRLKAIWLLLPDRGGVASAALTARALKARFPDLVYQPDRNNPTPEATNPNPLYRAPGGALFFVYPQLGVYFGDLCPVSSG